MRRTWKLEIPGLVIKRCESKDRANQERAASRIAARIGGRVKAAAVYGQISSILIFDLIPGKLLSEQPDETSVSRALQVLASIHATPVPEGVMNHYHGESLRNRLKQELEFVGEWPGLSQDKIEIVARATREPSLSRSKLQRIPPVLGHGDFRVSNLVCTPQGGVVPIDWIDLGLCDPRYEWAHFLNSLDAVLETQPGIERFSKLAWRILCPKLDEKVFESELRLGEIINRVIVAGHKARMVLGHGENEERLGTLDAQIERLRHIL